MPDNELNDVTDFPSVNQPTNQHKKERKKERGNQPTTKR
jgi:hypothetical protein